MPDWAVVVVNERAMPSSTITTLGPTPISQPSLFSQVLKAFIVEKKQSVAKGLRPGLQSVGCGYRAIKAGCLAANAQHTFAVLSADEKTTLDDFGKDQDALGAGGHFFSVRCGLVQVFSRRDRHRG